jgi:hypothetical protein
MLLWLLLLCALCAGLRFFFLRYTGRRKLSNAVTICFAAAYILSLPAYGLFAGGLARFSSATVTVPPVVTSAATAPPLLHLTSADLDRLKLIPTPAAVGNIDVLTVSTSVSSARGRHATLAPSGWAVDANKVPGSALVFVIDGKTRIDGTSHYGLDRPDVAKSFASPAMEHSGFAGTLTVDLAPGRHLLDIGVVDRDGIQFHKLATGKSFAL